MMHDFTLDFMILWILNSSQSREHNFFFFFTTLNSQLLRSYGAKGASPQNSCPTFVVLSPHTQSLVATVVATVVAKVVDKILSPGGKILSPEGRTFPHKSG